MNRDELLAEAKRKYPIGTVVYPIFGSSKTKGFTIDDDNFEFLDKKDTRIIIHVKEYADTDDNTIAIHGYEKDTWARIVKAVINPEVIINNYSIF